ncbi:MAG: alpha-amylase family glycosyl hydrolase [Pseudomonadota bacterium]
MLRHPRNTEIIYQVYPASFKDSSGDGHGDLQGIISKLDYIAALGVDAIWVSPFFQCPHGPEGDGGYAISDYRKINPEFGTMADFQDLLTHTHKRDLRLYTDFVVPHTADSHDWFLKSRNGDATYGDFYTWRDPVLDKDGNRHPPNNWKSVFGGDAWSYDETRQQYYLHHFLKSQPALNHNNPAVRSAVMTEMKFWLDMGVDGFRIDALPFATHDPQCRDNPWLQTAPPKAGGFRDQYFQHSTCQPGTIKLCQDIRRLCDSYDRPITTLGEAICGPEGGRNAVPVAASYVDAQSGLSMCYTDALLRISGLPSAQVWADMVNDIEGYFPTGGNCNSACNHDKERSASRLTKGLPEDEKTEIIKQLLQFFIMLPGSFCMYQGEELGLPNARIPEDIPIADLKDPRTLTQGPAYSRDGERTPMPWQQKAKNAGFSDNDSVYLPVPDSHIPLAVDVQEKDPHSILHFTRDLLRWRKKQPALLHGFAKAETVNKNIVKIIRSSDRQTLIGYFNVTDKAVHFELDGKMQKLPAYSSHFTGALA